MDPLSLLAGIFAGATTALGLLLTLVNLREKLWPKPPKAHPLEDRLREIALAIRDLKPQSP